MSSGTPDIEWECMGDGAGGKGVKTVLSALHVLQSSEEGTAMTKAFILCFHFPNTFYLH